jgi:hypothetical protein
MRAAFCITANCHSALLTKADIGTQPRNVSFVRRSAISVAKAVGDFVPKPYSPHQLPAAKIRISGRRDRRPMGTISEKRWPPSSIATGATPQESLTPTRSKLSPRYRKIRSSLIT